MPPKVFTVLLALGLASSAFAQKTERPMNFAGVPFGAPPEEAMRILGTRPGVIVPETLPSNPDKLELTGGNFAAQEVLKWTFEFVNGKFAAGTVVLKPDGNGLAVHRELRDHLAAKYGPAAGVRKPGPSNADKKNRQSSGGKKKEDTYGTVSFWRFPVTLADKDAKVIVCEAAGPDGAEVTEEAKIQVTLYYIDETLKPLTSKGGVSGVAKSGSAPVKKEDL